MSVPAASGPGDGTAEGGASPLFENLDQAFFSVDPEEDRLIQVSAAASEVLGIDVRRLREDPDRSSAPSGASPRVYGVITDASDRKRAGSP